MKRLAEMIECALIPKVEEIGIENFEGQCLDDLKDWLEIEKNCLIIDAMHEDEKGYVEPDYRMNKDDYKKHDAEYYRDMDRRKGILYYTEPNHRVSEYDNAMKVYSEHKRNNPKEEQESMRAIEKVANVFMSDIKDWIPQMTPSEKTMLRQKLTNITNMIG